MARRGKKITPSEQKRILQLLERYSPAVVASTVSRSVSVIYKVQNRNRHFKDLSSTAITIANNLEKYRKHATHLAPTDLLGWGMFERIAVSYLIDLDVINEDKAQDLLTHLKKEFPELKRISSWTDLPYDALKSDFINRLRMKAYSADYKGLCPRCPGVPNQVL